MSLRYDSIVSEESLRSVIRLPSHSGSKRRSVSGVSDVVCMAVLLSLASLQGKGYEKNCLKIAFAGVLGYTATMTHFSHAFISLGSNTPDAGRRVDHAVAELAHLPGCVIRSISRAYLTEPQDYVQQPWFVNRVVWLDCNAGQWSAESLLNTLLGMESAAGRVRSSDPAMRFGPRCIDMDLLLFGDICSTNPVCMLPHPRMHLRAFVLVPLRDIAPEVRLFLGKTPDGWLKTLEYWIKDNQIFQH